MLLVTLALEYVIGSFGVFSSEEKQSGTVMWLAYARPPFIEYNDL